MAKSRKPPAEEESFYDAFLTPTQERAQPAVTTDDEPETSAPAATPSADDTLTVTPATIDPIREQEAVAEMPGDDVAAQAGVPQANTGRGVGRRRDPSYMQASAYVPRQLRRQVDRALLNDPGERDYSELIEELLQQWLKDQGMSA